MHPIHTDDTQENMDARLPDVYSIFLNSPPTEVLSCSCLPSACGFACGFDSTCTFPPPSASGASSAGFSTCRAESRCQPHFPLALSMLKQVKRCCSIGETSIEAHSRLF
jgi:hypothetical protein